MKNRVLTMDRKKRFVLEYLRDLHQGRAAIRAGMSRQSAAQLMKDPWIRERIEQAQAEFAVKYDITQDKIVRDILDIGEMAIAEKQFMVALRAKELIGRHVGMWPVKALEVIPEGEGPIAANPVVLRLEDMTPEERGKLKELVLRAKAKERAQQAEEVEDD